MDLFQIVEITKKNEHAGTKAAEDITNIAAKQGFNRIYIRMNTTKDTKSAKVKRQVGYYSDWTKCYHQIARGALVLLQHPFHHRQLTREKILRKLKENKHVKFISLVHDVEELRGFRYSNYYKHEFDVMLELADIIIVHNHAMHTWFVKQGISENRLVDLHIFDYLQTRVPNNPPDYAKAITVAGNLDTVKCGYISQLGRIKEIEVNLFGPNFDENMRFYSNIRYKGSFPAEIIPTLLTKGYGLVWDGESIEDCQGTSGQYLRYNNPHKLSLYLSSGLPVIIWGKAAEAEFVKKHGVGICVDSLVELPKVISTISESDYKEYVKCVENVRDRLLEGHYTKMAMQKAIERLL